MVRDYEEDGKQIPAFTNFEGLYQRAAEHENQPPFDLPQRWIDKRASLNLVTKYNFVSDADIIGGNSGSPVVNKAQRIRRHHFRRQHSIARP
jgi:V8-like Glu-specific endopeptidase